MAEGVETKQKKKFDTSTREGWLEIISAVLMSIAVVGSAYCAWQATRWSGEQATVARDRYMSGALFITYIN